MCGGHWIIPADICKGTYQVRGTRPNADRACGYYSSRNLRCLNQRNNLELGLKEALMDKEVALEHNSTYANPWILDLFKHVASAEKKILFLSDMYLPEQVIESLLREKDLLQKKS